MSRYPERVPRRMPSLGSNRYRRPAQLRSEFRATLIFFALACAVTLYLTVEVLREPSGAGAIVVIDDLLVMVGLLFAAYADYRIKLDGGEGLRHRTAVRQLRTAERRTRRFVVLGL